MSEHTADPTDDGGEEAGSPPTPSDEVDATERRSLTLPANVVAALERRVERTEFETVDEYAAFALELLVREVDRADEGPVADAERYDHDGEDEVEERLESLGYL